jgi:Flp pilus assembly protein TadG
MNRIFLKAKRMTSVQWRDNSGQAVMEFSLVATMLIVLAFGVIDFSRAIYLREVLINLSREAANLEARGTGSTTGEIMTNALNATLLSASPLSLNSSTGMIIVTAVTNFGGGFHISQQIKSGTLVGAVSKVGSAVNGTATLPTIKGGGSFLPANHTVYVAEVFYKFTAITPVGNFFKGVLPTQLYDAAYFSAL